MKATKLKAILHEVTNGVGGGHIRGMGIEPGDVSGSTDYADDNALEADTLKDIFQRFLLRYHTDLHTKTKVKNKNKT